MITLNLMFLLLVGSHGSNTVIKDFCNSSLEITIKTKRNIDVIDFSKFKRSNREHGQLVCSRDLKDKSSGEGVSLTIHDNENDRQFRIVIDSCYSEMLVDKHPTRLCRYTIETRQFFVAQIDLGKNKIDVVFGKEDYDFAIEILKGMTIENEAQ